MAPNQYAIGVTKNKFALCESEEEVDPHELLKQQEKEKETRKKAKLVEKANATKPPARSAKTNSVKPPNSVKQNNAAKVPTFSKRSPDTAPTQKEGFKPRQSFPPNSRKQANFHENNQPTQRKSFEEPQNQGYADRSGEMADRIDSRGDGSSGSESGGPERGRGGKRGFARVFVRGGGRGRGGYTGEDRRKRDYERHSGSDKTGVKPVDKRRSGGSYNWGNPQDEVKESVEAVDSQPQEEFWPEPEGKPTEVAAEEPANEGTAPLPDSESKEELTLDEWKALKSSRPKPAYNLRKPGEGEDLSKWNNMVALNKKPDEEEEEEEFDYGEFPQRVGRQKRLELDVRFYDRFQDRRGRGRGGFRRPSPGGRLQQHQHQQQPTPAPKVDDELDFPSLVKAI